MNDEMKVRATTAILYDLYQVDIEERSADYLRGAIAAIDAVLEMKEVEG